MRMGGWLYTCGHFHPSDFVQVAKCKTECSDCSNAKKILEQAKHLRRRKLTAAPVYVTVSKYLVDDKKPLKRVPDCFMNY